MLRRYIVECREGYVFSVDGFTAIECVKQWCVENGADIEDVIFRAKEV